MQISRQSYFVKQLISRHHTSIARLHCQSPLHLLQMSQRVIDISVMTSGHRSLGHLVVLTKANLSVVILRHTVNISARYKHCTIAFPISTTIIADVSPRYRHLGEDQLPLVVRASPSSLDYCIRPSSLDYGIRLLS